MPQAKIQEVGFPVPVAVDFPAGFPVGVEVDSPLVEVDWLFPANLAWVVDFRAVVFPEEQCPVAAAAWAVVWACQV
ncbi:MAG: hypothetical protein QF600_01085 [Verrucomicrobiota bacterium]|nr:hypothetical protein [Verrucomicrobiota bacterium]